AGGMEHLEASRRYRGQRPELPPVEDARGQGRIK
ncbi:MAG: hypothetical protein FD129_1119, partial [bacterium]